MFAKIKEFNRKYKRRGQALVFYAVLIPTMLVFAGAGLDLGWYYLTVSRMQNASDAAVMAGAWKFLEDEGTLSDFSDAKLIDFVPRYILEDPDTGEAIRSSRSTATGDAAAKDYVKKNLSPEKSIWDGDNIVDAYEKTNILNFASNLYGRGKDLDDYGYYTMWYQVILAEDVKHFFLPGWFAPMEAKVQSVAKITHYIEGPNLFEQTLAIAEKQTKASWDHIRAARYQFDPTLYEDEAEKKKAKTPPIWPPIKSPTNAPSCRQATSTEQATKTALKFCV